MDKREMYKAVFEDTIQLCQTRDLLRNAVTASNQQQYLVKDQTVIKTDQTKRYAHPAKIIVSKKRSLEAAGNKEYEGMKVCVHNFASATNPGGGVVNGASAQEECICRCSTLYPNLTQEAVCRDFYQQHKMLIKQGKMNAAYNDDCIFTPGVVVFKTDDDQYRLMAEDAWYRVDVITCAAPNLRNNPSNAMNPGSGANVSDLSVAQLRQLHKKRLQKMLSIAKKEKEEVLILGAFGCGAFRNPAWVVSEAFHEVIQEFLYDFRVIEFAVYCRPRDVSNYETFCKVFQP